MTRWVPLRRKDFSFNPVLDVISFIRHRVTNYNESYDFLATGPKGSGKSTMALSICYRYNPNFDVKKHVAFSVQEWLEKSKTLKRGDIVMCDEMGTRQFGSSHKWMSQENQELSDIVQLNRTDGISMIGTTLDEMRVTNRVRSTYSVYVHSEEKVKVPHYEKNENGERIFKGYYLAIRCLIRFRKTDLFNQNGGNDYLIYPRNGPKCIIKRVLLFHPPNEIFEEYSKQRDALKQKMVEEQRAKSAEQTLIGERKQGTRTEDAIDDALMKALSNGRRRKK